MIKKESMKYRRNPKSIGRKFDRNGNGGVMKVTQVGNGETTPPNPRSSGKFWIKRSKLVERIWNLWKKGVYVIVIKMVKKEKKKEKKG